jgi:hypothetical protein
MTPLPSLTDMEPKDPSTRVSRNREPAGSRRRKRGAQPGNLNALKHGFYSRQFANLELEDLDASLEHGLSNEINMLRVAARRLFDLASNQENQSLEQAGRTLSLLSMAAGKLATISRVQHMLGGNQEDDTLKVIVETIQEVIQEKNLSL